jgi:hypothetical protein
MTRQDYLHLAAGFLGGWAAVHVAVESRALPWAPVEVEKVPGDVGYIGSDEIYANWAAVQADIHAPAAIMAQAHSLALDVLRPRLDQIVALAELAVHSGLVSEDTLRSEITR